MRASLNILSNPSRSWRRCFAPSLPAYAWVWPKLETRRWRVWYDKWLPLPAGSDGLEGRGSGLHWPWPLGMSPLAHASPGGTEGVLGYINHNNPKMHKFGSASYLPFCYSWTKGVWSCRSLTNTQIAWWRQYLETAAMPSGFEWSITFG